MELGHLLTRSGLTCPEAASEVCSVQLPSVRLASGLKCDGDKQVKLTKRIRSRCCGYSEDCVVIMCFDYVVLRVW
jgi:hypothetical protein